MDLVKVDGVHLESAQAVFAFLADRRLAQDGAHLALLAPHLTALREHVRPLALPLRQRPRDHLLRATQPVDGRGIDPVDAEIERGVDGSHRVVVLLAAPAELPVAATDGPGAEADGSDVEVRVTEGSFFHR